MARSSTSRESSRGVSGGFPAFAVVSLAIHVGAAAWLARARHEGPPAAAPAAEAAPALAGETFELGDPGDDGIEIDEVEPAPTAPSEAPAEPGASEARAAPRAARHVARAAAKKGSPGAATEPALYGAVGERGVADLTTAFTRAFPQVASADPVWASVAFGDAGAADVRLTLDAAGNLAGAEVTGGSPALRAGLSRTLHLIRGRTFTAHGAVTRLHVTARVSPDEVHDGLHGDVFALGGSVSGAEGSAFFALSIGRRVDVRVRVR